MTKRAPAGTVSASTLCTPHAVFCGACCPQIALPWKWIGADHGSYVPRPVLTRQILVPPQPAQANQHIKTLFLCKAATHMLIDPHQVEGWDLVKFPKARTVLSNGETVVGPFWYPIDKRVADVPPDEVVEVRRLALHTCVGAGGWGRGGGGEGVGVGVGGSGGCGGGGGEAWGHRVTDARPLGCA
jgi:hypothetical protein